MSKRLTPEHYRNLAASRGFEWLDDGLIIKDNKTKTRWRCSQGHEWKSTYNWIQGGNGCPRCAPNARVTTDDYHALAAERGFKWLGSGRTPSHTPTYWQCSNGHEWRASYHSLVTAGSGCPHCAGLARLTAEDYRAVAASFGIEWIESAQGLSANVKQRWRCSCGYEWDAAYHVVKGGRGCLRCSGNALLTAERYKDLAQQRGFEWVETTRPLTGKTKQLWRCPKGHEWEAKYHDINRGSGCPYCAGSMPLTAEQYKHLAKQRNLEWVSPSRPLTSGTKHLWRCPNGHEWETRYHNVKRRKGCPYCLDYVNGHLVSKPQRAICAILNGEMNTSFKKNHSIDIAVTVNGIRIAIEYDAWHWHKDKPEHDKRKTRALILAGWRVIRVKSNWATPTKRQLDRAIQQILSGKEYVEIKLKDWLGK